MEDWLKAAGLGAHVEAFKREGVTVDQLARLSEADLRELGLKLGDRHRFRDALTERPPLDPARPPRGGERRPLTIMFIDIVSSSKLTEEMDSEDWLEVIRRYRTFCGDAVARYGGGIARAIGDGLLTYFCYPVANGNDPERAVRAALDIAGGIGALATPAPRPLSVRIGIATGQVVISDLFEGGARDRNSIVGPAPNLAAKLQSLARPGGVLIAEETHERIRHAFISEDLGTIDIQGLEGGRRVHRVIEQLMQRERAPRPARLTPLIGRDSELAALTWRWRRAQDGHGNIVLLSGEAGIGKSRLVETFLDRSSEWPRRTLRMFASELDIDSPLQPIINWLSIVAGIEKDQPPTVKIERLKSALAADVESGTDLAILARLVGIAAGPSPTLSPEQLRERTMEILEAQLLASAEAGPLVVVFEDLHWLDPTSLALLDRVVRRLDGRPILIVATARESFEPPWKGAADSATIPLTRLGGEEVGAMLKSLSGGRAIPPLLLRQIARRTDGVPLFVEEVVRSLKAQGVDLTDPKRDPEQLARGASEAVPASLAESMMARLDRSGVAKEIAQMAAVIGRTVRRDVLAAVAELSGAGLETPLEALGEAGILFADDRLGADTYSFTHALLCDAAYGSLLRERRQALHLRVARALQNLAPETRERQPELLAKHLTEGGHADEATPLWSEAAKRSLERSALTEASRLLDRGLEALAAMAPTDTNLELRVQLMALQGPALIALHGPGSHEARTLYATAYALCRDLPENSSHFPIYWGWWRVGLDLNTRFERALTMRALAEERGHPELRMQAHHCSWPSHFHRGGLSSCICEVEAGLALYDQHDFRHHARLYGNHDVKVCGHGNLAQAFWMQGRPTRALAEEARAVAWAETLDHLGSLAHARDMRLLHHVYRRDHRAVFTQAGELAEFTSAHGLDDHRAKALLFRGWAVALTEAPEAGLATLREGFDRQLEIGTNEDFPVNVALLAEALLACRRGDEAVALLGRWRQEFARDGLRSWAPELARLEAEAILLADPASLDAARGAFAAAINEAVAQEAHMLCLRAATGLARLELERGDAASGHAMLADALAGIAEDDGGADMLAARAMLARLAARGAPVLLAS